MRIGGGVRLGWKDWGGDNGGRSSVYIKSSNCQSVHLVWSCFWGAQPKHKLFNSVINVHWYIIWQFVNTIVRYFGEP